MDEVQKYIANQHDIFKLVGKKNKSERDYKKLEKLYSEQNKLSESERVREYIENRVAAGEI